MILILTVIIMTLMVMVTVQRSFVVVKNAVMTVNDS